VRYLEVLLILTILHAISLDTPTSSPWLAAVAEMEPKPPTEPSHAWIRRQTTFHVAQKLKIDKINGSKYRFKNECSTLITVPR